MNTKDFFIGALVGGIVGAAASLLLAPKSGKELRSDLVEQAHTMKEKTSSLTSNAMEKGSLYAQLAKEKSSNIAKTVTEQSSYVADKVKELTDNVKKDIEQLSKSASDLGYDIKEASNEIADNTTSEVHQLYEAVTDGEIDDEFEQNK